jgi:serine/threonine protein kinase
VHRDLKLANLLIHFPDYNLLGLDSVGKREFLNNVDFTKVKFHIKIADLGLAARLNGERPRASTVCGTPLYMSPEIEKETSYDYKVDIWALGVIYYELITG